MFLHISLIVFIVLSLISSTCSLIRPLSPSHKRLISADAVARLLDFNELKTLEDRCSSISNRESEYLLTFWSTELQSFQLDPSSVPSSNYEGPRHKVAVTTTCLAISTILSNPSHWESLCSWDSGRMICLREVCDILIQVPWREDDFFQQAVLVDLLGQLKVKDISSYHDAKIDSAVSLLIQQRPRLSLHRQQKMSSYLRHLNAKALSSYLSYNADSVNETTRSDINHSFRRANDVAFDELCRQIAFYTSSDSANFDVVVLTYSLVSYFQIATSFFINTKTLGIIPQANMNLVANALKIIFSVQASDGTWRKGKGCYVMPINLINYCYVVFWNFE